jgi:hypothetical protein
VRARLSGPSWFTVAVATTAAVLLLALAVPAIGPALRAARAEGVRGTFTAGYSRCVSHLGHEACSWYGTFTVDGENRDVYLYGSATLAQGQRVPAIDIGRRAYVYGPGGSNEWIATSLLLLAGVGLLWPLAAKWRSHSRSRRASQTM